MAEVTVPDELLAAAGLTDDQMAAEVALEMYRREKLTMGQAAQLAEVDLVAFWRLMAARDIYIHYDAEDLEQDISSLREFGRLT